MRADEGALVALDTVGFLPDRNKGGHATLLIGGRALLPGTVDGNLVGADGEQVAVLGVNRADKFANVGRLVAYDGFVLGQVGPGRVYGQLLVLAAAVNGLIVLVDTSWPFLP